MALLFAGIMTTPKPTARYLAGRRRGGSNEMERDERDSAAKS